MTTATRPLPDHGTYARANGSPGYRAPCRCDTCVPVRRAGRKRMEVNRQLGRPGWIDAAPARRHLALLHTEMSWRVIAEATGCDRDTVMNIHSGKNPRATRGTVLKILAVKPTGKMTGTLCIDATGTSRRIQALQATGRLLTFIAEAAGTTRWRLGLLAEGRQATVTQAIAERVAEAYDELASAPVADTPSASRARKIAAGKGWHDPLWWEDMGRIDDPAFDPATAERPLRRDELGALRRDEIIHLTRYGYTPESIHQRLNEEISLSAIRNIVVEHRNGKKRDRTKQAAA
jgi:hypothetical protein